MAKRSRYGDESGLAPPERPLLELAPAEALRRLALERLAEARRAAARLRDAEDPDALHDFRVALRRLRSLLRAGKSPLRGSVRGRDRRALRRLQQETGAGRDAEVGLEGLSSLPAPSDAAARRERETLLARLEADKGAGWTRAADALSADFEAPAERLARDLLRWRQEFDLRHSAVCTGLGVECAAWLRSAGSETLQRLAALEREPTAAAVHAARLAAKRLRYLLEVLPEATPGAASLLRDCRHIQNELGRCHDDHVLADWLGTVAGECPAAVAWARPRVEARAAEELASHRRRWSAERCAEYGSRIDALARGCESAGTRGLEIERKFLMRDPGARRLRALAPEAEVLEIAQGWLPGERIRERLRRTRSAQGVVYHRALKSGTGVVRREIEEEISAELFRRLWPLTAGRRVRKRHYRIPAGDHWLEIDRFLDRKLWLLEVELPSAEARVVLPEWLSACVQREVSDEADYTNFRLAR